MNGFTLPHGEIRQVRCARSFDAGADVSVGQGTSADAIQPVLEVGARTVIGALHYHVGLRQIAVVAMLIGFAIKPEAGAGQLHDAFAAAKDDAPSSSELTMVPLYVAV